MKLAVIAMVNAEDGVPYQFSYQALDLVGAAIAESTAPALAERRADPTWEPYLGDYADPWGWESQVMILDERLVLYSLQLSARATTQPVASHPSSR